MKSNTHILNGNEDKFQQVAGQGGLSDDPKTLFVSPVYSWKENRERVRTFSRNMRSLAEQKRKEEAEQKRKEEIMKMYSDLFSPPKEASVQNLWLLANADIERRLRKRSPSRYAEPPDAAQKETAQEPRPHLRPLLHTFESPDAAQKETAQEPRPHLRTLLHTFESPDAAQVEMAQEPLPHLRTPLELPAAASADAEAETAEPPHAQTARRDNTRGLRALQERLTRKHLVLGATGASALLAAHLYSLNHRRNK